MKIFGVKCQKFIDVKNIFNMDMWVLGDWQIVVMVIDFWFVKLIR